MLITTAIKNKYFTTKEVKKESNIWELAQYQEKVNTKARTSFTAVLKNSSCRMLGSTIARHAAREPLASGYNVATRRCPLALPGSTSGCSIWETWKAGSVGRCNQKGRGRRCGAPSRKGKKREGRIPRSFWNKRASVKLDLRIGLRLPGCDVGVAATA